MRTDPHAAAGRILQLFYDAYPVDSWEDIENDLHAAIVKEIEEVIEAGKLADYCNRLGWPSSP